MVLSPSSGLIAASQPQPDPLSGFDPVGQVFHVAGRVLRGIRPGRRADVETLLASGLVAALVERRLFPRTSVADIDLPGFALTLEHHRLHPMVLPGEWTFEMLRDGALALLRVNWIAREFSYETKDAHAYNLCFVGTRAMFFDFGSLVRRAAPHGGWQAYEEFVRGVLYPLALSATAGPSVLRMLLDYQLEHLITHLEYYRLRAGGWGRFLPLDSAARLRRLYGGVRALGRAEGPIAERLTPHPRVNATMALARRSGLWRSVVADLDRLGRHVQSIRRSIAPSGRHDSSARDEALVPVLVELVDSLDIQSVLLLDGGDGRLALALAERGLVRTVTSADADHDSVECAYAAFKRSGLGSCSAAVVDFLEESRSVRAPRLPDRYRAELVVMGSAGPHLLERRGVQPSFLVDRLMEFCLGYAALGLKVDSDARRYFFERFEAIRETPFGRDMVLLVGRKRAAFATARF